MRRIRIAEVEEEEEEEEEDDDEDDGEEETVDVVDDEDDEEEDGEVKSIARALLAALISSGTIEVGIPRGLISNTPVMNDAMALVSRGGLVGTSSSRPSTATHTDMRVASEER